MAVAVVASAWQRVRLVDSGHNLRQNLAEPLGADVLLSLTYRWDDGCNSTLSCGLQQKLAGIWPLVTRLELLPMESITDLVRRFEQLPHWPAILQAFNHTVSVDVHPLHNLSGPHGVFHNHHSILYNTCVRDPDWKELSGMGFADRTKLKHTKVAKSPYYCDGLNTDGNTIFAPVIGPTNLNLLWQLQGLCRLRLLVELQERAARIRYERVIVTRLDYHWLAMHPPLTMMPLQCAHVPFGEDAENGLNDRHAVLNREHAAIYLSQWDDILSGGIMRTHQALRIGVVRHVSGEGALAAHLSFYRVPVCRFAPVAHLTCCDGAEDSVDGKSAESRARKGGKLKKLRFVQNVSLSRSVLPADRCHNPLCIKATASLPIQGGKSHARRAIAGSSHLVVRGKYLTELRLSLFHAAALQLPGAKWIVTRSSVNISSVGVGACSVRALPELNLTRKKEMMDQMALLPGIRKSGEHVPWRHAWLATARELTVQFLFRQFSPVSGGQCLMIHAPALYARVFNHTMQRAFGAHSRRSGAHKAFRDEEKLRFLLRWA